MVPIQLPIKNFPAQQEVFDDPARFVMLAKGRRFGFTRGAANNTIKVALAGKFKRGLWVDTVNSNIERYVERYFLPTLRKLPERLWHWRVQQKILRIKDFEMDFRSADTPENIEGFGYDYVILNEAGIILKKRYLFDYAIRPMLWDYKPKIYIGGAPKGKGIFHDLYQRGLDVNQPDYKSFKHSSFDNPYVQHDLIMEDIKAMPERVVRQEIYAEFLEDDGAVFQRVSDIAILDQKEPETDHLYVIGCDLAKLQDFTVITVYDRKDNHQVYQMRFNKIEWPYIRSKVKEVSDKYNHALVILDGTGVGDPTYDDLSREGVPVECYKFTNESKKNLIEKLANWIELKNLYMLKLEDTINELNSFTYDYSEKTGRVIYGAPQGFHDDIVISHALAVWSLQPIIVSKQVEEMSIIERDLYDKRKSFEDQDNELQYEEV
jgi:hypothetical protein